MKGNFARNSWKCPQSKSLRNCLTKLFPIYQNKYWTIRWGDNCSVDPLSHRNILKILTGFVLPGGTPTQANGTTTGAPLPFDAKLENELASAPKGLILIVKEPGESKLIAGKVSNT